MAMHSQLAGDSSRQAHQCSCRALIADCRSIVLLESNMGYDQLYRLVQEAKHSGKQVNRTSNGSLHTDQSLIGICLRPGRGFLSICHAFGAPCDK